MAMVYHLVEDLGLDVNGPDQPPSQRALPMRRGTPLCYVADSEVIVYTEGSEDKAILDTRELTWYLLDHGADPRPALEKIKWSQHPTFVADVDAWRARKRSPVILWKNKALKSWKRIARKFSSFFLVLHPSPVSDTGCCQRRGGGLKTTCPVTEDSASHSSIDSSDDLKVNDS
jgi:hypothetical protein